MDYEYLADFLADSEVEIFASLPCYLEDNVDKQRGKGVFAKSISALKMLNNLGYGQPNSKLQLNLVFNLQGTTSKTKPHLTELRNTTFSGQSINVRQHCYACTAG